MKNPFSNKCPVCRSSELRNADGWTQVLGPYAMKPLGCIACGAQFEPNISSRIGLWLFMSLLFLFVFADNSLNEVFGKDISFAIFLAVIGLFSALVVIAAIAEPFRPRQFTLWNDKNTKRAIVNYGSVISFLVYGVLFYFYIRTASH